LDGSPPAGSRGGALIGGLGRKKLKRFVKLHIIFALKYNKQELLLLLDKINDITSKILGRDITMDVPLQNIGGDMSPPVPYGSMPLV